MKLFSLTMENIARNFVNELKKGFPNAHWIRLEIGTLEIIDHSKNMEDI